MTAVTCPTCPTGQPRLAVRPPASLHVNPTYVTAGKLPVTFACNYSVMNRRYVNFCEHFDLVSNLQWDKGHLSGLFINL